MAVTCTVYDDGTHHRYHLTGTGTFTLNDLYDYLYTYAGDAETYMTRTGSVGSYVYTSKVWAGEHYTQIYINNGVTFELEDGDTHNIEWGSSSATDWVYYVYQTGTLKLGEGCTIDNNTNSGTYGRGRIAFPGTFISNGTEANPNKILHMRDYYLYMQYTTPWDVNWTTFGRTENRTYTTWTFRLGVDSATDYTSKRNSVNHAFKNCTVYDYNKYGYLYLYYPMDNWVLENITVDNIYHVYTWQTSGTLKNWLFTNCRSWNPYGRTSSHLTNHKYKTASFGANSYYTYISNQPMLIYDGCTWTNQDYGAYALMARLASVVMVKDCTINPHTYSIYANENSKVLYYGTNTYTGTRVWSNGGTHLYVRMFTLTVNDPDGNPLENAQVAIRTKLTKTIDGRDYPREDWAFTTDENGQVLRGDGLGIYLVEKEETSNGVFAQWSDGTGDNVHIITVTHPDYATHTEEIAMTEDKVRTITMDEVGGTVIYDSTLYDTTVY